MAATCTTRNLYKIITIPNLNIFGCLLSNFQTILNTGIIIICWKNREKLVMNKIFMYICCCYGNGSTYKANL